MKAVILVGGFGTRLRPLTCTRPKQLLPLANSTLIEFMIERLKQHGIQEIIFAAGYGIEQLQATLGDGTHLDVSLHYSPEKVPLGTAGPIKQAEPFLRGTDLFFVLNGDIIAEMDYRQMVNFHQQHDATATIALYRVEDPSRYGVVDLTPENRIRTFIEKPAPGTAPSNLINAGCYILNESVLDVIPPGKKVSIERETFPQLCETGGVYGWEHTGLWIDMGTPASYLEANHAILNAMMRADKESTTPSKFLKQGNQVIPPVVIGGEVIIAGSSIIGPNVSIGRAVTIGPNTRIHDAVIFDDVVIGEGAVIEQSVIGQGAIIGQGVQLQELSIIGDNAIVDAGVEIPQGAKICPNKRVREGMKPDALFC